MADNSICKIDGCDKSAVNARGWCKIHYDRWLRHGDPLVCKKAMAPRGAPKAFIDAALQYRGDDCLLWPFSKNGHGYAQIRIAKKGYLVSRLICEQVYGPPTGDRGQAAHSCGNGHMGCVNPSHLSWKTASENQMDRVAHGTSNRGENYGMAVLTERDVREIRRLSSQMTQTALSRMFGTSLTNVHCIIHRKTWAHVT